MMNVFPAWDEVHILNFEPDTFYYWHRRAIEIKTGKPIAETETLDSGKVDDEAFKKQLEYMNRKESEIEKSKEGTISG